MSGRIPRHSLRLVQIGASLDYDLKEMGMRAFLAAGLAVIVVSIGAMEILERWVQQPVSAAFATSAVRR